MVTQFDEKGKIFTQVVTKRPVEVIIQTAQNIIHGEIHVRQDSRVKDELNSSEHFIAVTNAVVYNSQNEELYRAGFLVVNTSHMIWILPKEEITR